MKIIIHAGFAKAGSTTIQSALALNSMKLKRAGFLTFGEDLTLARDGQWHGIPQWKIQRSAASKTVLTKAIEEEIKGVRENVILSTENLEFPYMAPLFSGLDQLADVDVVFYMRPQIGYIPSAWKQWFSKDGTPLDAFVETCLFEGRPAYQRTIDAWESALPSATIKVRPFVKEVMEGGNPAVDFFNLIGFSNFILSNTEVSNQSLDFSLTHLMMRNAVKVFNGIHDTRLEVELNKILSPIYKKSNATLLSKEASDRISERFRSETLCILSNYCNVGEEEVFYQKHFVQKFNDKTYMDMTEKEILTRSFHVLLNTIGEKRMSEILGSAFYQIIEAGD